MDRIAIRRTAMARVARASSTSTARFGAASVLVVAMLGVTQTAFGAVDFPTIPSAEAASVSVALDRHAPPRTAEAVHHRVERAKADRIEQQRADKKAAARKAAQKKAKLARQAAAERRAAALRATRAAAAVRPGTNRALGKQMAASRGWGDAQFVCLDRLWTRESGWSQRASGSSGAYGIPQALPGSKMAAAGSDWASNPRTQITWGLNYIKHRYGSPCGAWGAFLSKGWY